MIDTTTAGREHDILTLLADALGTSTDAVALREIVLTHGHDDHTGSAAALARRTGARVLGPALEADIIEGRRARDIASHDGRPMPGVFNVDPGQAALSYTALAALRPDIACFGNGEPHHSQNL